MPRINLGFLSKYSRPGYFFLWGGAVILGIFYSSTTPQAARYTFRYIGVQNCARCHGDGSLGNQVAAWKKDPHAKAYQRLVEPSKRLTKLSTKLKLVSPEKDFRCLKCHTTGGHRVDNNFTEGVGCEACHGPGQRYASFGVHVGPGGYERAVKAGMFHIIGDDRIGFRRRICLSCHYPPQRPCLPDNAKERAKEILSLQQIVAGFAHNLAR